MNYAPALSTACCSSCGDEHPVAVLVLYRFELICPTCREDHDKAPCCANGKASGNTVAAPCWACCDESDRHNRSLPADQQVD